MRSRRPALTSWLVYSGLLAVAVGIFFVVRRAGAGLVAPPASAQVGAHVGRAEPGTLLHV